MVVLLVDVVLNTGAAAPVFCIYQYVSLNNNCKARIIPFSGPTSGLSVLASRAHCRCAAGTRHVSYQDHSLRITAFPLTVITAHRACKIRFKIWAWIVFFGLIAVTARKLVFKFGFGVVHWDLHAHVRVIFGSSSLRFFLALILILNLFLFL